EAAFAARASNDVVERVARDDRGIALRLREAADQSAGESLFGAEHAQPLMRTMLCNGRICAEEGRRHGDPVRRMRKIQRQMMAVDAPAPRTWYAVLASNHGVVFV